MDLQTITTFLQNGLPDATGGVLSAIAIDLFKKAKSFFTSENITSDEVEKLLNENKDFSDTVLKLEAELNKSGRSYNFHGNIDKQIIIEKNDGDITM